MWTVAQISPITFSEVRLGSAADSNMAAAAVAWVHMLARTSVWQADDFDMCFTQKRPEIVRNTCAKIVKLDCNILFVVVFFCVCVFSAYIRIQLSNRGLTLLRLNSQAVPRGTRARTCTPTHPPTYSMKRTADYLPRPDQTQTVAGNSSESGVSLDFWFTWARKRGCKMEATECGNSPTNDQIVLVYDMISYR